MKMIRLIILWLLEYTNGTTGTNKIGVGAETVPSVEKLFTINAEDVKNTICK